MKPLGNLGREILLGVLWAAIVSFSEWLWFCYLNIYDIILNTSLYTLQITVLLFYLRTSIQFFGTLSFSLNQLYHPLSLHSPMYAWRR